MTPISKLIEKWVESQFSKYLNEFNLLYKSQSGFRPEHSTESALILMTESWLKAINEGKSMAGVARHTKMFASVIRFIQQ